MPQSSQSSGTTRRSRNPMVAALSDRIIGQTSAIETIASFVQVYEAGLSPQGRPAGIFLLLGPTGTGKTKTVEALAAELHGSEKSLLKIDCGEFQMEHEVAKLVGAPPGYLGHRETQALLTQQRLRSVTSDRCGLSLVLFDEIEKAAPSLARLLLGVLDRGQLRLGDNSIVNFEQCMIFLTSNVGAQAILHQLQPGFGLASALPPDSADAGGRVERCALSALRRQFSPEFLNRIDCTVTYQPLGSDALRQILKHQLAQLQAHLDERLGARSFPLEVDESAFQWLLQSGTSRHYGARELQRVLFRHVLQPVAELVAESRVRPRQPVRASQHGDGLVLEQFSAAA